MPVNITTRYIIRVRIKPLPDACEHESPDLKASHAEALQRDIFQLGTCVILRVRMVKKIQWIVFFSLDHLNRQLITMAVDCTTTFTPTKTDGTRLTTLLGSMNIYLRVKNLKCKEKSPQCFCSHDYQEMHMINLNLKDVIPKLRYVELLIEFLNSENQNLSSQW